MQGRPIVVLDFETTGLSAKDRVIEIAAIRVEESRETVFHRLCDPGFSLPWRITEITGLTNGDLAGQPAPHVAIQELQEAVLYDEPLLVAHNASFDLRFLNQEYRQAGLPLYGGPVICTRNLARGLFPTLGTYKLADLIAYLGIVNDRAHRALDDVRATHAALQQMLAVADARQLDPLLFGALRGTRFDGTLRDVPLASTGKAKAETAATKTPKPAKPEPYIPRALQRFLQMADRKGKQR
ncbi:MAG TPA: 3'-5' exonuclease [Symbiobacteriaceae bacterium]|nr:3'-5' exonuclease [Symbiobacteriaceae bacterium]